MQGILAANDSKNSSTHNQRTEHAKKLTFSIEKREKHDFCIILVFQKIDQL